MRSLSGFCFVLALLSAALPAGADPTVRLSWDTCDPIVPNQDFTGPDVDLLVASATDISGSHIGYALGLIVLAADGAPLPDAWRFDADGCFGADELYADHYAVTKSCPVLITSNPSVGLGVFFDVPGNPPGSLSIRFLMVGDATTASPAVRYTLARIFFDHTRAVAGFGVPGETCGDAEIPVCIYLKEALLYPPDPPPVPMNLENAGITWQGAHFGAGACMAAIPARPSTWGRMKALYR